MSFPETLAGLKAAGYERDYYTRCRGCGAAMEWWATPNGNHIPMNPMPQPDSPAISHFATCVKAEQFRKEPRRCTTPKTSTLPDSQPFLFSPSSSPQSDSLDAGPAPSPPVVHPKQKEEN